MGFLKDALKTVGGAAIGGAVWTAQKAGQGAKHLHKKFKENNEKIKEIKRIEEYCKNLQEELNREQQSRENALTIEKEKYSKLCEETIKIAGIICEYQKYCNEQAAKINLSDTKNMDLNNSATLDGVEITGKSIASGALAGAAAGGGAAGLMALLGTASTGTAISSLSGAAFTNALLAALGGGSIASGGFGILGGTIVLGSLVAFPALAVGGYIADKKINEAYEKALNCEEKANNVKAECKELFRVYDQLILYLRNINSSFKSFQRTYKKLINPSVVAVNNSVFKKEYDAVIDYATNVANRFMSIELLTSDKKIPSDLEAKIEALENDTDTCKEKYALIYDKMSRPEKEYIDGMGEVTVENLREKIKNMETKIAKQSKKIKEYEKAYKMLQESNEKLQEDLENATSELEQMRIENEKLKEINNELKNSMPEEYNYYKNLIQSRFTNLKTEKIIEFLATAELQYEMYRKAACPNLFLIVLAYCNATETLLIMVLDFKNIVSEKKVREEKLMLGKLVSSYVKNKEYVSYWPPKFYKELFAVAEIRGYAAHGAIIEESKMENARRITMGDINNEGLIMSMNNMLKE